MIPAGLLGLVPGKVWIGVGLSIAAAVGLWYVRSQGVAAGRAEGEAKLQAERLDWQIERTAAAAVSADWERQAREADGRERDRERMLADIVRKVDHDGQVQTERLRADAGRADAAVVGLRAQLGAVVADAASAAEAGASAADARFRAAAAEATRVHADLLGRCHERSVARARFAEEAATAGARCERWGDAVATER